ncbi:hypothetical protein L1987_20226 [Smallanthus sonchifolius]|uniref:Uncharacterized protein n=1 Tax=Smallanthus sonchifolius TaxID=185202 RepID=A0ACB9ITA2_9ASTR|nr:hypothetical protein L1987_20226 [Smallanthus sonchifolius]
MPTFTTIALQNLLEHRIPANKQEEENDEEEKSKARKRLNHIYISPALYTTPQPTPILDYSSSGSVSPSPYVFNRKGRGGGKSANRRIDGFEVQTREELVESSLFGGGGGEIEIRPVVEAEDADDDDFVDP